MRSLAVTVAFLALAALTPARARLGETEAQLNARLGKRYDDPSFGRDHPLYHRDGFTIRVWLAKGVSVAEEYRGTSLLGPGQIETLLTAESGGHPWTMTSRAAPHSGSWVQANGTTAMLDGSTFKFETEAYRRKAGYSPVPVPAANSRPASPIEPASPFFFRQPSIGSG